MSKKLILIAGTPAEHSIQHQYDDNKRDFASRTYNYAIASLKANKEIAGQNEYEVELLDYPVSRDMEVLDKRDIFNIVNMSPDVVGFSVYCWNKDIFLNTARYIKKLDKGIKIIMGGPSVSFGAETLLKNNRYVDIIVVGDAEEKLSQLLFNDFGSLSDINGIVYRENGVILKTPQGRNPDINTLFSPYLFDNFLPKSDTLLIEPSRGCLYRCRFCAWSKNGSLNIKRGDILKEELRWAYNKGYRKINFSDTSINMTNEQLKIISDSLKGSGVSKKLSMSVFMKYEKIDSTQVKIISNLKFDEIILGIESVNDNVLKECGKLPLNKERLENIIKILGSMGSKFTLSVITGLPLDSYEGIRNTVEYLESLIDKYPDFINFICSFWLAVLPGTRFAIDAKKYGFKYLKRGTPYITSSKYMSKRDLIKTAEYIYNKTKTNKKFFCEEYYIEVLEKGL